MTDDTTKVIKGLGVIVALLPSAAILLGAVPLPPGIKALIQWLSSGLSFVLIAMVFLLADVVGRWAKPLTGLVVGLAFVIGVLIATAYYDFARSHLVDPPVGTGEQLVSPRHPSDELKSLMAPYREDYREALATSIQRQRIEELLKHESGSAILTMTVLLLLAQTFMVTAILVGAVRLAHS